MRLPHAVTATVVALTAATVGLAVVLAAPVSARSATVPGHGAVTQPARIVSPQVSRAVRAHSLTNSAVSADLASFNWSGYVAQGDTYSSVTSNWTQPAVVCSSKGIVSFWVGLDGWGDSTVEQTGSGVDCRTGTPQYYAWWETFPTNSQQTYAGVAVEPGDAMSASVTVTGAKYSLTISDSTQDWTRTTLAAAPAGATNATAEVVAEAASLNTAVTQLPNFGSATFTGSAIDGGSLQAASAQSINMVNNDSGVIASTGPADDTGDFTVGYTGGAGNGVLGAFQQADGTLHTYTATGDTPQQQTVAPGTSPAIIPLPAGYETAYQGTNGDLMLAGPGGTTDAGLGMAPGTSPSITGLAAGAWEVAFQANTGVLWTYTSTGVASNVALSMAAGTSPSITTLAGGRIIIAFQANTGSLSTSQGAGHVSRNLSLGMAPGTSPSIASLPTAGYVIAFQANTGDLWVVNSATGVTADQGLGMAAGTDPNIAAASGGGFGVAFQANTGSLWTMISGVGGRDQKLAMAAGTNPAIVSVPGGWETAVQAASGDFMVSGAAGGVDTRQPMAKNTSPDIAP